MKKLIALAFVVFSTSAYAAPFSQDEGAVSIPDSKNRIIKLTESGILPQNLVMKADDSIVFFLNDTKDALTSLELDYKGKRAHCASQNVKIGDDGIARSKKPFGPKDFATVCFHDPGTYALTIYGLKKNPKGLTSTITVQ